MVVTVEHHNYDLYNYELNLLYVLNLGVYMYYN